jgi:hypothetical protein
MTTKKTIAVALSFAFVFFVLETHAQAATQPTNAELIKTIQELRAEIRVLKAQLNDKNATTTTTTTNKLRLKQEYGIGATNEEIKILQKILATDASIYPEGMVTGYFGPLTAKAITRLQTKYKLENRGVLTAETRDFINSILEAHGIENAFIPADILKTGSSRVEIESEIKDGVRKLKFKIKDEDKEDDNDNKDDDSDDEDEDDEDDEDSDEDNSDEDEDED